MQCGTASVTTTIGSESMHGDLPWNGAVTDSPQVFADEAVQLYNDNKRWLEAQYNGLTIINQRYLKALFVEDFNKQILFLQANLQQHRITNFFGAMLQHHTLSSTKYMSRWIEAKNK
jgi:hypothetical protein